MGYSVGPLNVVDPLQKLENIIIKLYFKKLSANSENQNGMRYKSNMSAWPDLGVSTKGTSPVQELNKSAGTHIV